MKPRSGNLVIAVALVVLVTACKDETTCSVSVVDQNDVTVSSASVVVSGDYNCSGTVRVHALRDSVGTDPGTTKMMYWLEPADVDSVGTDPGT